MQRKSFIKTILLLITLFFGKQHASLNYDNYEYQRNLIGQETPNKIMFEGGHGPACPVCKRGQMCPMFAGCAPESSRYNVYPAPPEYQATPLNR